MSRFLPVYFMPSSIAHYLVASVMMRCRPLRNSDERLNHFAAVSAVLLDLDAVGRPFGFPDIALLGGHRAITHSLVAALCLALCGVLAIAPTSSNRSIIDLIFVFCAIASHGRVCPRSS